MLTEKQKTEIRIHCGEIKERLISQHLMKFNDTDRSLVLISTTYPGVWLEHFYDCVMFAKMFPEYTYAAVDTANIFMDGQKENGQLPFAVIQNKEHIFKYRYSQTQECVSFVSLALQIYEMTGDKAFLQRVFDSGKAWVAWHEKYRMTTGRGLVEMFVGYDTGHDNSGRLEGLLHKGNRSEDTTLLPEEEDVAPIVAVDLNCIYYGNIKSLEKAALLLDKREEAAALAEKAKTFKRRFIDYCYDKKDAFFYDRDKNGVVRKFLSCTVFSLFIERVLNQAEDGEMINEIFTRHIENPDEFNTPYPYPSMAISDPSWKKHTPSNCWGYFTEELTAFRATLWMDDYEKAEQLDFLCEKHLEAWTEHYDQIKFGQELDPLTGEPSACSEYYSSCMLFYLWSAKRLGIL